MVDSKDKTTVKRSDKTIAPSDPEDQKVLKPGDKLTVEVASVEHFKPTVVVTGADKTEKDGEISYTVTGDVVVTVTWEEQPRFTLTVVDEKGAIHVEKDGVRIEPSPNPVFKPDEEFVLILPEVPYFKPTVKVTGAEKQEKNGKTVYIVKGDVVVTVTWEEQPRFTLTVNDPEQHTTVEKDGVVITPSPDPVFKPNERIVVKVQPRGGFRPKVTVQGAERQEDGSYIVTGDVLVSVEWIELPVDLAALRVPAVFTPNGDGVNDTWEIPAKDAEKRDLRKKVQVHDVRVYDRWGVTVFVAKDSYTGWNGRDLSGNELPTDSYYYNLEIALEGKTIRRSGTITIVR